MKPTEDEVKQAIAQIKLARYLITKGDTRGMTHGEKHYFLQTSLALLSDAQFKLGDHNYNTFGRNEVQTLEPSDIPGEGRDRF